MLLFCFLKYFLYFISGVVVLAAGLLVYLVWFQAPFYFPKPTGKYAVGIKTYHWIDTKRKEILSDDPNHPNRELMVNIWYPTQKKLDKTPMTPYAPYLVDHFKKNHPFGWILYAAHRTVYSYAKLEAPIATDEQNYPVVIFSHGSEVTRDHNTAECEELASHGYLVVGISHTYNSQIVKFPDGRMVDGRKTMKERCKNKNLKQVLQQFDKDSETWVADVSFVIDQLEKLNSDKESTFYQHIDQKNIGIFGHSVGGGTAAQVCRHDPRVKAGVSLDGFLLGSNATIGFDKPFLSILAGDRANTFARPWTQNDWEKFGMSSLDDEKMFKSYYLPAFESLFRSVNYDKYTVVINGAGHLDFCDIAFLRYASYFWRTLMTSGIADGAFCTETIDGFRATEIVNAYLVNFFDKYLKDQPSDLLDGGNKRYTEVETK